MGTNKILMINNHLTYYIPHLSIKFEEKIVQERAFNKIVYVFGLRNNAVKIMPLDRGAIPF